MPVRGLGPNRALQPYAGFDLAPHGFVGVAGEIAERFDEDVADHAVRLLIRYRFRGESTNTRHEDSEWGEWLFP